MTLMMVGNISLESWKEHFRDLLGGVDVKTEGIRGAMDNEEVMGEALMDWEITTAENRLKKKKAAGMDGIPGEAGLKEMCVETKVRIRGKEGLSVEIWIKMGLRQGCLLSPALFCLYIAGLEEDFRARGVGGVLIDKNEENDYADDDDDVDDNDDDVNDENDHVDSNNDHRNNYDYDDNKDFDINV
ncbi:prostatic spermine-binding protein-like [Copidosoma floridanum]|uniref:prostatic spermine-binding protein-like n=1 Tax=Copidosoma floridanum TaxID=29053 RepID=UPI000C6F7AF9|nr:prostatic spermine-binding protein-like [Copidosoma floridanum]